MTDIVELIKQRQRKASEKTGNPAPEPSNEPRSAPPSSRAQHAEGRPITPRGDPAPQALAMVERGSPDNRWELFARRYLMGLPPDLPPMQASAAYASVYGAKGRTAHVNAYRLLGNENFRPILLRVAQEMWERMDITETEVREHLTSSMRANVYDYFDVKDERLVLRDANDLPPALQRNVKKLKVTTRTIERVGLEPIHEQTVELEVIDRLRALEMAARVLAMFKGQGDSNLAEKIAEAIREGQKRAQNRGVIWDAETGRPVFTN